MEERTLADFEQALVAAMQLCQDTDRAARAFRKEAGCKAKVQGGGKMQCPYCKGKGRIDVMEKGQQHAAEKVIESYYRRRAAGSKVTLKQMAEAYGYHRTYLSQVKKEYDLAGKWGSKKKVS
jgi:hypothetical protein